MSINHIISLILPLTFVLLVYGSISSFNVFALPPDPKYDSSNTCGAATIFGDLTKKTCCWSERIPGKLPPNNNANYCQTCTFDKVDGAYNCNQPQQQLRPSPNGVSSEEEVLEQPPTSSLESTGPLQERGVLEESIIASPTATREDDQ